MPVLLLVIPTAVALLLLLALLVSVVVRSVRGEDWTTALTADQLDAPFHLAPTQETILSEVAC